MAGRFVNILIPGKRKTLTLCEVEVYGAPEGKFAMARFLAPIVTIVVNLVEARFCN